MMMHSLFVYGTLRRSQSTARSGVLQAEGAVFVAEGTITGPWRKTSLGGGLPALVRNKSPLEPSNAVEGEFWQVSDETLTRTLDWIEGHPNFYRREQVETERGPTWVYFISPEYWRRYA